MRVVVNETEPILKAVKDLSIYAAFKYRDCWYVKIHISEDNIQAYDDFFDDHVIKDGWNEEAENFDDYVACLHLSAQTLCYLRKDIQVAEYGTPTLSVALYQ
jgi:hypothetical protein